jgi:hypothetical protein
MPVRAVNLKLVVPRRPDNLDQARSLWSRHRAVNEATRQYEQVVVIDPLLLFWRHRNPLETISIGNYNGLEKGIKNARKRLSKHHFLAISKMPDQAKSEPNQRCQGFSQTTTYVW